MNLEDAIRIGIPLELAGNYAHISIEEACTQRCIDCDAVIAIHQDANWRFRPHRIRCDCCAERAMQNGYDQFEAYYVV